MIRLSLTPRRPEAVHLLQITDTHIAADPLARFDGIDTWASLRQVIRGFEMSKVPVDAVLLTGDIVADPDPAAYARILPLLQALPAPVWCIAGNHDSPEMMRKIVNCGNVSSPRVVDFDRWIIVLLNDYLPGSHGGYLGSDELTFLRDMLASRPGAYALIAVHHPPVSIASPWMDAMMLENPDDLFQVLAEFPRARAVLCGHIHQAFSGRHGKLQILASPSTCVQFKPRTDCYTKDTRAPGFRLITLHADGTLDTRIDRVGDPGVTSVTEIT